LKNSCVSWMKVRHMRSKCSECSEELKAVYPLNEKTYVDFLICPKCKIAYDPKNLKPIAHVI